MAKFLKKVSEIISDGNENKLNNAISQFLCKDKDVELFLKTKAIEFERRNKSRTYLLLEENEDSDIFTILGYFTLSLKVLTFGDMVSKSSIKRIDGFDKDANSVAVLLVGQFGKSLSAKITGDYLMMRCLSKLVQVREMVGGRIVLIECLPIQKVTSFYVRNGFTFLQTDETDKFNQMILVL